MPKRKLLIIQDERTVFKQLKLSLSNSFDITVASNPGEVKKVIATGEFPVVILDLSLPSQPNSSEVGLSLLKKIPEISPLTKVVVITGNNDKETAMEATYLGAVDICSEPIDIEVIKVILDRIFRMHELELASRKRGYHPTSSVFHGMTGVSMPMQRIFETISKIAETDYPVLITGKSGTGKELVARAIWEKSKRADKPFIIINCGSIPENLIESELFGHEKGAFTGANSPRAGKFEQADKGTIFLDEIGELPLPMQVKLLRVLQEGTIERIGSSRPKKMDVRIIAATNVDLEEHVKKGLFREDLFFRLNVIALRLPLLKEREEDVLILAYRFLREEAKALGKGRMSFSPAAAAAIASYRWPGNVRELQNSMKRAVAMAKSCILYPEDLGIPEIEEQSTLSTERKWYKGFFFGKGLPTLKEARSRAEIDAITKALAVTGNNKSQAAKILEISRPTLHDLIKKHGLTI